MKELIDYLNQSGLTGLVRTYMIAVGISSVIVFILIIYMIIKMSRTLNGRKKFMLDFKKKKKKGKHFTCNKLDMKKVTIICDACGREIQPSYFRSARLDFKVDKWDGGSVGGREDIFIQEADLCSECAHKLQKFIENELNIQPHHPN